jgi:hypothetical protein
MNHEPLLHPEKVGTRDVNHRRTAVILKGLGNCDICHTENCQVLDADTSEGEYGSIRICLKCCVRAFHIEPMPKPELFHEFNKPGKN